jgi:RNA polymerase sigma factor (sigma-70 family)
VSSARSFVPDPVDDPDGDAHPESGSRGPTGEVLREITAVVGRVVGARVRDPHLAEDLVQEALTRVIGSWDRVSPETAVPYAITVARNVVASTWRRVDTDDRNVHRVVDLLPVTRPEETVLGEEEAEAVGVALRRLSDDERHALLLHEVEGRALGTIADELGTTPGALAAQLKRTRARLRVEYLLAMHRSDPPTDRCRPVLVALSGGDRRRQGELDVAGHLLACTYCAELGRPLLDRTADDSMREVAVSADADVVRARQAGRELAGEVGFDATQGTVIATAISEVARNIVKFAGTGQVRIGRVDDGTRSGLVVIARDAGPGIPDVELALTDGHSTYGGLGLGLPGCRRLMDEFVLDSGPDRGTTVTMHKWLTGDAGAGRREGAR